MKLHDKSVENFECLYSYICDEMLTISDWHQMLADVFVPSTSVHFSNNDNPSVPDQARKIWIS